MCTALIELSLARGSSARKPLLGTQACTAAVASAVPRRAEPWTSKRSRYDDLLMSGVSREEARAQTRPVIDRILTAWSEAG